MSGGQIKLESAGKAKMVILSSSKNRKQVFSLAPFEED